MSMIHGTDAAYRKGCPCDRCRKAHADQTARNRQKRFERGVKHGSSGFDDGCRCETCTTAHRARYADYYSRLRNQNRDAS